jgi:hypothetical protein
LTGKAAALLFLVCLIVPSTAHANGDPASHGLLGERLFLPLDAPVDSDAADRLEALLEAADKSGFPIRVNGEPDRQAARPLVSLPPPGRDATKLANGATVAVRRLARAAGRTITVPKGGSEARDRMMVAAATVLGLAVLAALMLYHRKSRTLSP